MPPFDDAPRDESVEDDGDGIPAWFESGEMDVREDEDEMCDHDDYKEVVSLRETRGGNVMGVGGQFGTSEAVIVCKKCGKARPVEWVDGNRGPFDFDV